MPKHNQEMEFQLQSIQLENFKCFKKSPEINLHKLTILTGANSSGKSSIIQALMSVLQSKGFPFLYSTNGKYVNMGDFKDISHKHIQNNEIKLNLKFYSEQEGITLLIKTSWKRNNINNLPSLFSLKCDCQFFKLSILTKSKKYYLNYKYDPNKDPEATPEAKSTIISLFKILKFDSPKKEDGSNSDSDKTGFEDYFSACNIINKEVVFDEDGDIPDITNKNLGHRLTFLKGIFTSFERKSNLISSFRLHPSRTHLEQAQDALKVRKFGEGYLDQIINWENTKNKKLDELIEITTDLGLIYSIETKRMGGGRYDQVVSTSKSGVKDSLSDVGFGVSQFLPILVADLQLPKNSLLISAEPEIHLHPKVQSKFADYLTNKIKTHNKNYLIETHSEYLLNKLRLAIVKDELKIEHFSIYYIENIRGESKITELIFNKRGAIENAPKDFFDTYMMDLKELAFSV